MVSINKSHSKHLKSLLFNSLCQDSQQGAELLFLGTVVYHF